MVTRSIGLATVLAAALMGCEGNTGLATADGGGAGSAGGASGNKAGAGLLSAGGARGDAGASGGAPAGGGGEGGGGGAASVTSPAACSVPMGDRVYIDDATAFMAALPGTWLRCGHALTSNESELGIQIGADGSFALLVPGADGGATPSTALLEKGQVMLTANGPFNGHLNFMLGFATEANLIYETEPFFTNGMPLELVTVNTDIFWLRYVRVAP